VYCFLFKENTQNPSKVSSTFSRVFGKHGSNLEHPHNLLIVIAEKHIFRVVYTILLEFINSNEEQRKFECGSFDGAAQRVIVKGQTSNKKLLYPTKIQI
jgi:hypothetical protein